MMSTEDFIWSFLVGIIFLILYGYAINLCSAIWDYQNDKPEDEKEEMDVLVKDLMIVQYWALYFHGYIQFIASITPPFHPISATLISWISYIMSTFLIASYAISAYYDFCYTFHADIMAEMGVKIVRLQS